MISVENILLSFFLFSKRRSRELSRVIEISFSVFLVVLTLVSIIVNIINLKMRTEYLILKT